MTIYELEKRSGVSRPNIRFYEKERLIAPQRLANGYRDYQEEDVLLLERIILLRRLDMPLDAIRAVISGELPLPLALEHQQAVLTQKQAEAQQARQLCVAIQQDERGGVLALDYDVYMGGERTSSAQMEITWRV